MRCHGRTANADTVLYFFKYQIVLPSGHHPTKLYILSAHARLLHSGMKASLDHTFGWSRAEPLSKILLESVCYVRSMSAKPIEGSSTSFAVIQGAGSTSILTYWCRFTGQTTWISARQSLDSTVHWLCDKAVHLDLVDNMTANAVIHSFKRFSAKRGPPLSMRLDNGCTFEATTKKIKLVLSSQSTWSARKLNGDSMHLEPHGGEGFSRG